MLGFPLQRTLWQKGWVGLGAETVSPGTGLGSSRLNLLKLGWMRNNRRLAGREQADDQISLFCLKFLKLWKISFSSKRLMTLPLGIKMMAVCTPVLMSEQEQQGWGGTIGLARQDPAATAQRHEKVLSCRDKSRENEQGLITFLWKRSLQKGTRAIKNI